jgi:sarcosine oxidase, subunit gamma
MSELSGKIAVMDQCPQGEIPARSPLYQQVGQPSPAAAAAHGVYLWEEGLRTHLILRGNAEDKAFCDGAQAAVGVALPSALGSASAGDWTACWLAPDEWLLLGPGDQAFAMETKLRESLSGHYSVVNVSGGQTLLRVAGPDATSVLMKSTIYDVHERNFPPGKVVATMFAKSQATLRRIETDQWEMIVRRSFADYIWRWLVEAGREYGVRIGAPGQDGVEGASEAAQAGSAGN